MEEMGVPRIMEILKKAQDVKPYPDYRDFQDEGDSFYSDEEPVRNRHTPKEPRTPSNFQNDQDTNLRATIVRLY